MTIVKLRLPMFELILSTLISTMQTAGQTEGNLMHHVTPGKCVYLCLVPDVGSLLPLSTYLANTQHLAASIVLTTPKLSNKNIYKLFQFVLCLCMATEFFISTAVRKAFFFLILQKSIDCSHCLK